jgi:hypothetical protein
MRKSTNALKLLNEFKQAAFFWEAWVLLALVLMAFVIVSRGPSSRSLSTSVATYEPYQREKFRRDPYGIQTEPDTAESRRKVETGF